MKSFQASILAIELFRGVVLKVFTYDHELYALVQAVKKWKHYLLSKEIMIHIDY